MGSSRETTTQRSDPYAPAQPMINQGLREARSLYNRGDFEVQPYRRQMVADFDPLRSQAVDMAGGVVGSNLDAIGASQDTLRRAMDPNVSAGLKQNVIEGLMPSINATFSHSGMTGSDLHQQNLAKGLSTGLAQLEDNAQNRAIGAAQALPGIGNYATNQVSFLDQLGQGRQQHEQSGINADMLRHQQAQTAEMDALRNYMALSTGAGGAFGVQSSTTSGGGASPLGILGLGLQAAPLFSDRRTKEDIKRVGQMDDGTPVYTYRYKGGSTYHMGVMADEVKNPKAVTTLPNGLQAVYYGEL